MEEHGNWGKITDLEKLDASALAEGVIKRNIFAPGRFWDGWVMRHFTLPPGKSVPKHSHPWDHLVLPLAGHGAIEVEGEPDYDMVPGNWARVPGPSAHGFKNLGRTDFEFICIVPACGDPHADAEAERG